MAQNNIEKAAGEAAGAQAGARQQNPAILKTVIETIEMIYTNEGRYIIAEDELCDVLKQKGIDLDDVFEIVAELSGLASRHGVIFAPAVGGRYWILVTKEFYENWRDVIDATITYLEELPSWRDEAIAMFEDFVYKVAPSEYRRIIRRLEEILSDLS